LWKGFPIKLKKFAIVAFQKPQGLLAIGLSCQKFKVQVRPDDFPVVWMVLEVVDEIPEVQELVVVSAAVVGDDGHSAIAVMEKAKGRIIDEQCFFQVEAFQKLMRRHSDS
jgi:hypothetical protein